MSSSTAISALIEERREREREGNANFLIKIIGGLANMDNATATLSAAIAASQPAIQQSSETLNKYNTYLFASGEVGFSALALGFMLYVGCISGAEMRLPSTWLLMVFLSCVLSIAGGALTIFNEMNGINATENTEKNDIDIILLAVSTVMIVLAKALHPIGTSAILKNDCKMRPRDEEEGLCCFRFFGTGNSSDQIGATSTLMNAPSHSTNFGYN